MAKRETVKIDVEKCIGFAKCHRWKGIDLAEMVGKHKNWFSEVKRNRNLPSPEEAARICAILNVCPEEILLDQDDIDKVAVLIEGQKEKPTLVSESGSVNVVKIAGRDGSYFEKRLSDAQLSALKAMVEQLPDAPDGL